MGRTLPLLAPVVRSNWLPWVGNACSFIAKPPSNVATFDVLIDADEA
jgi:hypothetical protein